MVLSSSATKSEGILPSGIIARQPRLREETPSSQTRPGVIWPEIIGRSGRYRRSNSMSKASFKNMPPVYRSIAPPHNKANAGSGPLPPSNQAARQLDQTVGKLDTRPSTSSTRRLLANERFSPMVDPLIFANVYRS